MPLSMVWLQSDKMVIEGTLTESTTINDKASREKTFMDFQQTAKVFPNLALLTTLLQIFIIAVYYLIITIMLQTIAIINLAIARIYGSGLE